MITISKLKEYEEYHGYYDGFYMQRVKVGTNITNDDEWYLIGNLIQDVKLIKNGLASKEFSEVLNEKLKGSCDSKETIEQLKKIAYQGW